MFGRRKNKQEEKVNVKTYIDGVEQRGDDSPVPIPADATAPEPAPPVQEPTPQQVSLPHIPGGVIAQYQLPPGVECYICFDEGFYADTTGRWHHCPKCNPVSMKKSSTMKQAISPPVSSEEEERPSKGNLYEFRFCSECGARNEIHKKKIKWQCEHCGADQEVKSR